MRANKCGQVQTDPYAGWVGRVPCGKLALPTVHPHTDPWKAGSLVELEWASLPVGTLHSEQMDPSRGRQQSMRVRSGHMHIYRVCLLFTGDKFLNQKAKLTK